MVDDAECKADIGAQIVQISRRLREEREKARISQMDLSLQAGLSQNHVYCIESGKRTPNLETVLRLCNALRINPAVLFNPDSEERQKVRELVIELISKYI